MKYITGTYALNLPCELETLGDWHYSAINWNDVPLSDSDNSVYAESDIYLQQLQTGEVRFVANHMRAVLDLIEQGYFSAAQGMRDNFIGNERYTPEILNKVFMLQDKKNWPQIDAFMGREYLCDWLNYKRRRAEHGSY
jgi:hypothetical protein